jgi:hypothetical protein
MDNGLMYLQISVSAVIICGWQPKTASSYEESIFFARTGK